MVTLLCSFFFQQRTRLTTMFTRGSGTAEDIWFDENARGRIADWDAASRLMAARLAERRLARA